MSECRLESDKKIKHDKLVLVVEKMSPIYQ